MQCFFPQYVLEYTKTPFFVLNTAYDVFQVRNSKQLFIFIFIFISWIITYVLKLFLEFGNDRNVFWKQFHHYLVPPSADPHGDWYHCKLNPAACTAGQINILQGSHFALESFFSRKNDLVFYYFRCYLCCVFMSVWVNSVFLYFFLCFLIYPKVKRCFGFFQDSGKICLLLWVHCIITQQEEECLSIPALPIVKVNHKILGLLMILQE